MSVPELLRILVGRTGRVKAHYSDGSILLLSSSASYYIVVKPDGSHTCHLTSCALHNHRQRLRQILNFRNFQFQSSYYASWVLNEELAQRQICPRIFLTVPKWPSNVDEAHEKGCVTINDDLTYLQSCDGHTLLVLDAIGKRVSVSQPTIVHGSDPRQTLQILECKAFALFEMPPIWQKPLQLAQAVSDVSLSSASSSALDQASAVETLHNKESIPERLEFQNSSWWFQDTSVLPDDDIIAMEWTEEAIFRYDSETDEIQVNIEIDNSLMETTHNGRFIRHVRRQPMDVRIYSASALPPESPQNTDLGYSISAFAKRALVLRLLLLDLYASKTGLPRSSAAHAIVRRRCKSMPISQGVSVKIKAQQVTTEGVFVAYEDGRIRIKFVDRAILNLSADGITCDVILPSGERRIVSIDDPVGLERYCKATEAFKRWSRMNAANRRHAEALQSNIQHEIERCRCNAQILSWIAHKRRSY